MQVTGTNEIRGLDGCTVIFSQPWGDREQPCMEEGEVHIFFLIATIINFHFKKKKLCQVNQNHRTLLGPYYGYQLTNKKYSIAKAYKQSACLLLPGLLPFLLNFLCLANIF